MAIVVRDITTMPADLKVLVSRLGLSRSWP